MGLSNKYSVLMSVYAAETAPNLRMSLDSVLSQTLPPDEIVLVKDGPLTEELDKVIDECVSCHEGLFNVVPLEKNTGLGNALNVGLRQCKNEYVARMDSDDVCYPDRMQKQMDFLQAHPEVDILSGTIDEFDGSISNVTGRRVLPLGNEEIWRFAKTRCPFNHNCTVYKKSKVLEVAGYRTDLKRVEDHDLWMRMHAAGAVGANLADSILYARAGTDMHVRRHGRENARALHEFYRELWQLKEISFPRYIYDIVCACGLQLMPTWMHKMCYKLIRLKTRPYGSKPKVKEEAAKEVGGLYTGEMTQEEISEAQRLIFEIFSDVKQLCETQGLTLMLGGGSCLGAVRSRGFIPWDDDMDCIMPRADYEKLKLIFDSALGDKYVLQVPRVKGHRASNLFMKIIRRDGPEHVQPSHAGDPGEKGLWLDIVPMDFAPENAFKRVFKGLWCDFIAYVAVSRYLLKCRSAVYAAYMKRTPRGRLEYYFRNVLGFLASFMSYEGWYDYFDSVCRGKCETRLVTFASGTGHYLGECMPLDTFLPAGVGEFEGAQVLLPRKAHNYLRRHYGADYMTPPKSEHRKAHPIVRKIASTAAPVDETDGTYADVSEANALSAEADAASAVAADERAEAQADAAQYAGEAQADATADTIEAQADAAPDTNEAQADAAHDTIEAQASAGGAQR